MRLAETNQYEMFCQHIIFPSQDKMQQCFEDRYLFEQSAVQTDPLAVYKIINGALANHLLKL